jgi:hypothetical protein
MTTVYLNGLWEEAPGGTTGRFFALHGQVVAQRQAAGGADAPVPGIPGGT